MVDLEWVRWKERSLEFETQMNGVWTEDIAHVVQLDSYEDVQVYNFEVVQV